MSCKTYKYIVTLYPCASCFVPHTIKSFTCPINWHIIVYSQFDGENLYFHLSSDQTASFPSSALNYFISLCVRVTHPTNNQYLTHHTWAKPDTEVVYKTINIHQMKWRSYARPNTRNNCQKKPGCFPTQTNQWLEQPNTSYLCKRLTTVWPDQSHNPDTSSSEVNILTMLLIHIYLHFHIT